MPRPDNAIIDSDYQEQLRLRAEKQNEAVDKVYKLANALLEKQKICGKICCSCDSKCEELKNWLEG